MISSGILEHLEGGTDEFLAEVHRGSFHKLQAILVHNDPHSVLLEHSESTEMWAECIKGEFNDVNRKGMLYLSSSVLSASTENLYWKPEQPPPSTRIRRYSPSTMISQSL